MPCAGGGAVIVTSPERAAAMRHKPVYLAGAGHHTDHDRLTWAERITRSPAVVSAKRAFRMAGMNPSEMDFAEIYDCYTITVMITLEDAGFMPKGESGPWYAEHDTTYRGDFPVNTHGGQVVLRPTGRKHRRLLPGHGGCPSSSRPRRGPPDRAQHRRLR